MPPTIFLISNISAFVTNLVTLTFAILYCYRDVNPRYLRVFPLYLAISFLVELLVNQYFTLLLGFPLFGKHQAFARHMTYKLFTLFELFVFSWFLYQILYSDRMKKGLILLLVLFCLFFLWSSLPGQPGQSSNDLAVNLESLIVIIPCLVYFKELFARPVPGDLLREPSFWLVTGIFFYLATIIPLFLSGSYLYDRGFRKIAISLYSINNFALSIAYILFIKGFTCRIRRS